MRPYLVSTDAPTLGMSANSPVRHRPHHPAATHFAEDDVPSEPLAQERAQLHPILPPRLSSRSRHPGRADQRPDGAGAGPETSPRNASEVAILTIGDGAL